MHLLYLHQIIPGEEETVSFIDLPPNNLSKLPEKGILKKSCPYGGDVCSRGDKWCEADSQSDNQEMLSQSDNNLGAECMGERPRALSEVSELCSYSCALQHVSKASF